MRFAKDCFDIGLMVDPSRFRLAEWTDDLGFKLDHIIDVEGLVQHRFVFGSAVLKVNAAIQPLPAGPQSGFASFVTRGRRFELRDGSPTPGDCVPTAAGLPGQDGLHIEIVSPSVERAIGFYTEALGFERVDDSTARCGSGFAFFREGEKREGPPTLVGAGIRYLTLQVFDADAACSEAVAKGAILGRAPIDYGDVARYGFILDPDGNWIELSARRSVIANHAKPE